MKTKGRIYLAGPMTNLQFFNFPIFDDFKKLYEEFGYEVFSPADHDRMLLNKPKNWIPQESDSEGSWKTWAKHLNPPDLRKMLGDDLQWIAQNATHIAMLPGWENSKGANAEWALAKALNLNIKYYPVDASMSQKIVDEQKSWRIQ